MSRTSTAVVVVALTTMDGCPDVTTVKLCDDDAQALRELERMVIVVTNSGDKSTIRRGETWARVERCGSSGSKVCDYLFTIKEAAGSEA